MKKLFAVIGANYGDEGKGMVSAALYNKYLEQCPLTVLTNGGAQRGHTVSTGGGSSARFVFHHTGACKRSDKGRTYCPATFIINPMVLRQELNMLECSGWKTPDVFINEDCMVTTPFDMMANQVEELETDHAWGSTGMGVWHTLDRSRALTLKARELFDYAKYPVRDFDFLRTKLERISAYWQKRLGNPAIAPKAVAGYMSLFRSGDMIRNWLADVYDVFNRANVRLGTDGLLENMDVVIFENAQGLLLGKDHGEHATAFDTGLSAVDAVVPNLDPSALEDVQVYYVSRTYLTRHGTGRVRNECPKSLINGDMVDLTNVPNDWQGAMRYGMLDMYDLNARIKKDIAQSHFYAMSDHAKVMMTHVNEYPVRDDDMLDYPTSHVEGYDIWSPYDL